MKSRLEKAMEYIQGYFNKHSTCDDCKLIIQETGHCRLEDKVPCDWNVNIKESDGNDRE
ncbi:MAG: hypothetical protein MSG78_11385 [Clostridiales bacterium]|nr:hypothetical protein [Clostridiales bacterium]